MIFGADENGHNDLLSRITAFLATHDQYGTAMTKLTDTQTLILSAGARRPENVALPLPKGLAGAAAKMAVNRMIALGWLQEVDANLRRDEPLWRETGDGHGTTLAVTEAGLLAIGIEPKAVQATTATQNDAAGTPGPKLPTRREGTKQAMLVAMLRAPTGATMDEITSATGWQANTARGAMSGALGKKLGLVVTSAKKDERGRVYRIGQPAP
jgi:hypothetical protein